MTNTPLDLDAIETRATHPDLTPGPWRLDREQCDCSDGYCHDGEYVTGVLAPVPTAIAAERLTRTGEQPRDYDYHRGEIGDFTDADWELMTAARTDVPALVAEIRRLREQLAREERLHGDTIDDRDRIHEAADKLAYAVAPVEVLGEHSDMNDPWENALDHLTPAAEVAKLLAAARVQAIRDLADKADPQSPEISFFGDHGHIVGEWMRQQAKYEQQRLAAARSAAAPDPICGDPNDGDWCELEPGHDGNHQADTAEWAATPA